MRNNYEIKLDGMYTMVDSCEICGTSVENYFLIFPTPIKVGSSYQILRIVNNKTPSFWIYVDKIKRIIFEKEQVIITINDKSYALERIL